MGDTSIVRIVSRPAGGVTTVEIISNPPDEDQSAAAASVAARAATQKEIGERFSFVWQDARGVFTHEYELVDYTPGENPKVVCKWLRKSARDKTSKRKAGAKNGRAK